MNWVGKSKNRGINDVGEVFIRVVNDDRHSTQISFKKKSYLKITRNLHIVFAIDGTRLYFREASQYEGWKLNDGGSKRKGSNSAFTIKVNPQALPVSKIETGAYNLELDEDLMLWYIDTLNKLKPGTLKWNGKRR